MKRAYTKQNTQYWENRKSKAAPPPVQIYTAPASVDTPEIPFPEISYAGYDSPTTNTRGGQVNLPGTDPAAFQNIRALTLPYGGFNNTRNAYIGATDSIDLCARAWSGIPVCRNAVEVSVEFSNQPLFVKCKNKTVKKFFQEWLSAIKINQLKQEYFREYYRSGNVFMMLFEGKFGPAYFQNFQNAFGAKENRIPIRYELLNPLNIFVPVGLASPYTYVRMLSTYEIARLKNPLTEQDKQVFQNLPQTAKDQITSYSNSSIGIYVPMEPERLRFAFYKKQSYEPLAIPMLWPVLPDIEWKLLLKKQDKALVANVERILMLVKTGEAPNQWNKGKGINPRNIANLQSLLTNQTLNRVLVTDYSTTAEFVQPDLTGLGPEKYAIVNEDIREGLQSILTGDDKFANAQIKAKIFIQRLEEGQNGFLDFLNTEIGRICDVMGFRDKPLVGFRKINLQDEAVMARIITQLVQLGVLTGPQGVKALETSVYPDEDEIDEAQTKYVKDREDGKFYPLVGGSQDKEEAGAVGGGGRPTGTGTPKTSKKVGPIGKGSEEESTAELRKLSLNSIVEAMKARSNLEESIVTELKKKHKLKELSEVQLDAVGSLAFAIMASEPAAKWTKVVVKKAISHPPLVASEKMDELEEIQKQYGLKSAIEAVVVREARL